MTDNEWLLESKPLTDVELQAIVDIKKLMANYTNIHFQMDQNFLTKYLRAADWCVQKAFDLMKRIYKLKRDHPSCYGSKPLLDNMKLFNYNGRVLQKNLDNNCRRVFICKFGNMLPPCTYAEINTLDDIWFEIMLSVPETQINGLTMIGDCSGVNSSVLKWFTVKNLKFSSARMGSIPLRNWTVHLINMGPIINTCITITKPFLSKEVKERFYFHDKNYDKLHEIVGKQCLPEEYGGLCNSVDDDNFSHEFFFGKEKWYNANMSKKYGYIDCAAKRENKEVESS